MKIHLTAEDITVLFSDTDCIVIPDWDGDSCTINKVEDKFYIVRWEEYDPCTELLDIDSLVDVVLQDGVLLHEEEYLILLNHWRSQYDPLL